MFDVVIIGSGPAGLTAAIYGRRAGLSVLVLEKAPMSGGQLINTYEVDNYPGLQGMSGFDMGMKFREHAESMEAEFAEGEVLEIRLHGETKEVVTKNHVYEARAIIIAAGATHSRLDVPGEEELRGRGVSYCATCDGAFFRDKITAVAGGGDVAVEDAIFLSRFCKKVYLIHRRDQLRAAEMLQQKLFALSNVEILWDSTVEKISGLEQVEHISIRNKQTGEESELKVDGVFIAVGIRPQSESYTSLVEMDEMGYLVAGEDCRTNVEGIFAAGDIRTKDLRQVVTAVADGANAVNSVQKYFLSK
ncbi:MAG: thioredoxin-disulfide reductase [Lachnospiraceae bacterium]|jgi:thioredoxin reductase (NADPH)|nr:thioredoxin-disulfide reductase [Lachnospiraceae bacterium]